MAIVKRRATVKGMATFSIRLETDTKKELEEIAYKQRKSLGLLVSEIIEKELNRRRKNSNTA